MAVLEANIAPYRMSSVLLQTMLLLSYHILLNFSAYSLTIWQNPEWTPGIWFIASLKA